jgi:hypothetical protein
MWQKIQALWRRNKARYAEAVNRYGLPVILTAIVLRLLMAAGVVGLYKLGFSFEALETTDAGLFVAAWALVWPLGFVRWILAAILAPPLVRRWRVWRGLPAELPPPEPDPGPSDPPASP